VALSRERRHIIANQPAPPVGCCGLLAAAGLAGDLSDIMS